MKGYAETQCIVVYCSMYHAAKEGNKIGVISSGLAHHENTLWYFSSYYGRGVVEYYTTHHDVIMMFLIHIITTSPGRSNKYRTITIEGKK